MSLSAAGLWMRAAAWWNVPRASTSQVAGVTCATTPVPPVWMQGLPTVPAVTLVRTEPANHAVCLYVYTYIVCVFVCVCEREIYKIIYLVKETRDDSFLALKQR